MKISKRLQKIAKMVKYDTVADIGTDHGHLPIYLVQSGLAFKALATDVNPEPLASAQRNIVDCEPITGEISTRLCDGLDGVNPDDYAVCVISGMGGRLIIDILGQNLETARGFRQLLLSPQRDVCDVRIFLHQSGFRIDDEEMLEEKGKFYNILDTSPGHQTPYDDKGYVFGEILLSKKSKTLRKFVEIEIEKLVKIGRSEVKEYLQLHEEVLAWLSK